MFVQNLSDTFIEDAAVGQYFNDVPTVAQYLQKQTNQSKEDTHCIDALW